MPDSHCEVYLHIVWGTYLRQPLLAGNVREAAYQYIREGCQAMRVEVLALGGIADHVHTLVRLPTITVPDLDHRVKGRSSHLLRECGLSQGFGWQEGYSAFSVSRWDVPKIRRYIQEQPRHHAEGTAKAALELPGI